MAETTIPDYPRGITFEQVWAALMEDRRKSEEDRKRQEEDRKRREEEREEDRKRWEEKREKDRKRWEEERKRREEEREEDRKRWEKKREEDRLKSEKDWQELREAQKELAKQAKITDKIVGDLGNRFGEMVEHLVAPSITEKFRALGFDFEQISQNHEICSAGKCIAEVDLLLENGDVVMVVEVKSKPNQKDIKEHIHRMEVLRQRADVRNDTRKFQGAIAGAIMSKAVRDNIHRTGFYAIEQTGDTVKITIPENFKPREW